MIFNNLKVVCPAEPTKIRSMQLKSVTMPDNSVFYEPCNGCEFCNASDACKQCISRINTYFSSLKSEFDLFEPVSPNSL